MQLDRPMLTLAPTLDGDVLVALAQADAWFTPGRLHRLLDRHSEDGVRRVLRRLADQGVVSTLSAGNAVLYRLNRRHLAAGPLIELANLRWRLVDRLSESLERWTTPPVYASLFGSAARGPMTTDSDIDIFLVRPDRLTTATWDDDLTTLTHDVSAWTGNDTRVLEMTESDVRRSLTSEPVLGSIAEQGVPLVGESDWLSRLVYGASRHG